MRSADGSAGLPFVGDATFLRNVELVHLATRFGDLYVAFLPAGVAALADVIRSKESADRPRDRAALLTLRALLARQPKTS